MTPDSFRAPLTAVTGVALAAVSLLSSTANASTDTQETLPEPSSMVLGSPLEKPAVTSVVLAARRYYAFWNTGDERYARVALSPEFIDRTLPAGRPQGVDGPLVASRTFRAAVPDLRIHVEEMLVVGDRVIGRLRFTGHFTGTFGDRKGNGGAIDFRAIDIYRVKDGRITDNWHLEDNLTLMRQLGIVANPGDGNPALCQAPACERRRIP